MTKTKLKFNKYTLYNITFIIAILILFIIPMTHLDRTSYLLHDGRWWLNQYYEFYSTFPNTSPIALNGFNNSGLAINFFYPNTTLKLFEIPLILLNIQNPYIVMGVLSMIATLLTTLIIYLILKELKLEQPLLLSLFVVLIQLMPLNAQLTNSLPQQFAASFLYLGVYGIISKKYKYITISTILLLNTSFTTCVIAALVYAFTLLYQKANIKEYLLTGIYGIIGIVATLPLLIPIFKNIHSVSQPTQNFAAAKSPWTLLTYLTDNQLGTAQAYTVRSIGPLIVLVLMYITYTKYRNKILPITLIAISLISLSPRISGVITTPIQPGTWTRIWPLVIVCTIFALQNYNIKKHIKALISVMALLLVVISSSLMLLNFNDFKNTNYVAAVRKQNWKEAYRYVNINLDITLKNGHVILRSQPQDAADISPDYIPKKATLKDNLIVYQPPVILKSKYGLEKHAIDKGRKLKITINPKRKVTPLGVWHYDFIKYNIKTTNGYVNVSNHDMFEYHGTKKTTIFISLK